ncbi:hypothetical protein CBR_g12574 [Chara braunii]|uniref:Endonuclease/exonuclease/phosphatase domain-containing protein n=1 Tax=Chara braunii TaxID=69332 RepID=A0A388KS06_CHABU|nr:hypothetical protein CBR_g12574 [Chara braunii]|eukprot:GBG72855.1 hypothetical protein CBR_g12574 [Chara braunii]
MQDPAMDRMAGGAVGLDGMAWEESAPIHNIMAEQQLVDPYRILHPTLKAFTYLKRNRSQHTSASRIDFFLVSESLRGAVQSTGISDLLYSPGLDHKFIYLHLVLEAAVKRGPGFFKVNNSLLDSHIMKRHILETCEDYGTRTTSFPQLVGSLSMATAKASCILAARRSAKEKEMEAVLRLAERNLVAQPGSTQLEDALDAARQRLAEWKCWKDASIRLRARVKELEQGEKMTKYFFQNIKSNTRNKLIDRLCTGDTVASDPDGMLSAAYTPPGRINCHKQQ